LGPGAALLARSRRRPKKQNQEYVASREADESLPSVVREPSRCSSAARLAAERSVALD